MKRDNLIQLKQERAELTTSIRALIDEYSEIDIPAEKKEELTKQENRFDELNGKILSEEKQLERERLAGEIEDEKSEETPDERKQNIREAFCDYLRNSTHGNLEKYRALSQDNPTQAGYVVAPEEFSTDIIQTLNDLVFMRKLAKKFTLKKAQSMGFPKRTARMSTFAWGTEIEEPTADSSLKFGKREFIPKPGTGGILVSKTLVRNSAIDIDRYVKDELGNDFAFGMEKGYMTGNGAGQPLGIFTASDDGISTARDISTGNTATDIKYDGLIEAKFSIKQQHTTNLQWIFHRDAVKKIAKLKDSNGQYVWKPAVVGGQSDELMNLPVNMSENAPNTFTTGKYVGVLGNFNYYWIVDSLAMEIQALMELYALSNQVYYIGRIETDGMPVLEEAFSRITLG